MTGGRDLMKGNPETMEPAFGVELLRRVFTLAG